MEELFTEISQSRAATVAAFMIKSAKEQLQIRVAVQPILYDAFWNDTQATPDEILQALGSNGTRFVAIAGENVEHIATLAAIFGKSLSDFIPNESWQPRRAFIFNEDGSASLSPPAEGFNAWGLPIAADPE